MLFRSILLIIITTSIIIFVIISQQHPFNRVRGTESRYPDQTVSLLTAMDCTVVVVVAVVVLVVCKHCSSPKHFRS